MRLILRNLWHRFLYWLDEKFGRIPKARGAALDRMAGCCMNLKRLKGESDRNLRARCLDAILHKRTHENI